MLTNFFTYLHILVDTSHTCLYAADKLYCFQTSNNLISTLICYNPLLPSEEAVIIMLNILSAIHVLNIKSSHILLQSTMVQHSCLALPPKTPQLLKKYVT